MADPLRQYWRVGRQVGRTIYADTEGDSDGDSDGVLIGVMDTRELALDACTHHNNFIDSMKRSETPQPGRPS